MARPRIFESVEDFERLAGTYFDNCKAEGHPISWTGLCLAVGLSSRSGLDRYRRGEHGKEFCGPIKRALLRVEQYYEENNGGAKDIFALKNFGWKDRQDHAVETNDIVLVPPQRPKLSEEQIDAALKRLQEEI